MIQNNYSVLIALIDQALNCSMLNIHSGILTITIDRKNATQNVISHHDIIIATINTLVSTR